MRWLAIVILVIGAILAHDTLMAAQGHEAVAAEDYAGHDAHAHAHHHAPTTADAAPLDVPEPCGTVRDVAPPSQQPAPAFDDAPVALLPDPALAMRFAAASRSLVETPPAHPPDLDRSFFQVYRI